MIRKVFILSLLSIMTTACMTRGVQTADFGRQCPLGNTTEVSVTSNVDPRSFALETAAKAALRDGYERFQVVRGEGRGDSYVMLVKMIPVGDTVYSPDMVVARDILVARGATL